MSLLPYQPPTPPPSDPRPLTVSQLGAAIDSALRDHLPRTLRVVGEVSGFTDRTHWYFSLKDPSSVINCVMFATARRGTRFRPENGHEVVVTGRLEFFARQGRTQFYVEKIEPVGAGSLDLEFRRLCEELRAMGWFDHARKRPLPTFPRRIAVVTSRTGAALQDVLDTMKRRCPAVGVLVVDVRVQGEGAAAEVASAIRALGARAASLRIDAILVTRGGGSKEDLWTFNERIVAHAIVDSQIPVVAAIGHETDTTIAELVADERAATPTQAAMRLTPDTAALSEQLDSLGARLASLLRKELKHDALQLSSAARHPFFTDPASLVRAGAEQLRHHLRHLTAAARARLTGAAAAIERLSARLESHRPAAIYAQRRAGLDTAQSRLLTAARTLLARADPTALATRLDDAWDAAFDRRLARLDVAQRALDLVGPAAVLRRGYSCTLRADGAAVRSIHDIAPGDRLSTVVSDGSFPSTVGDAAPAPRPPEPSVAITRRRRRPTVPPDQMDLFTRAV